MNRDNVIAMFLGVAIGDALGMPIETMTASEIADKYGRVTNYLQPKGHVWYDSWPAGRWTDDTQLTLAIAESMIAQGRIDVEDIARRSISAMEECPIGWGNSTKESLARIKAGMPLLQAGNPKGVGNGVAMKMAPIAAYHGARQTIRPDERICQLALMTHGSDLAVHSAFAQTYGLLWVLMFAPRIMEEGDWDFHDSLLDFILAGVKEADRNMKEKGYSFTELKPKLIMSLASLKGLRTEFLESNPEQIANHYDGASCYVLNSQPFSFAMFLRNPYTIEALYDTINAGGDTDTNGSMVASLLGALNGTRIFPQQLIDGLWQKDRILKVANDFCDRFEID